MVDWSYCPAVELDPEVVSGAWVFRGIRVPVVALFENLEDGVTVNEFVELFTGVNLMHARSVLEHAAKSAWFLTLKILLDQGRPVPLSVHISDHRVSTSYELG